MIAVSLNVGGGVRLIKPAKLCMCTQNTTNTTKGWSGGAMVLGKLPVPGRPAIWIIVRQGPTALAVGAGGVVGTFLLSSILSFIFLPSLWETARYRLKYCLKGPLNPKPTNQPTNTTRTDARRRVCATMVGWLFWV